VSIVSKIVKFVPKGIVRPIAEWNPTSSVSTKECIIATSGSMRTVLTRSIQSQGDTTATKLAITREIEKRRRNQSQVQHRSQSQETLTNVTPTGKGKTTTGVSNEEPLLSSPGVKTTTFPGAQPACAA